MDIGSSDFHQTNTQVIGIDISTVICQRNKLLEILMQRDNTIENLLSKRRKLDTQRSEAIPQKQLNEQTRTDKQMQSHGKIRIDNAVEMDKNSKLSNSRGKSQKKSMKPPAKLECELSLQCALLKDLNKSLENENLNLKMVNEILRNNYAALNERLEHIQLQHKLTIAQLNDANQMLKSSIGTDKTKKRTAQHDDHSNLPTKERCLAIANRVATNYSDSESGEDCSVNESNSDVDVDTHYISDDNDLELIDPTPIIISLDDDSEADVDCESAKENTEAKKSNDNTCNGDDASTDDESDADPSIKPLSQYAVVTYRRPPENSP